MAFIKGINCIDVVNHELKRAYRLSSVVMSEEEMDIAGEGVQGKRAFSLLLCQEDPCCQIDHPY